MSIMSLAREEEVTKICGVCGIETDELENDCCSRCHQDNSPIEVKDQEVYLDCEVCSIETNSKYLTSGLCSQCDQERWSDGITEC